MCVGVYRDLRVQLSPSQHQHGGASHPEPDTGRPDPAAAAQTRGQMEHRRYSGGINRHITTFKPSEHGGSDTAHVQT